MISIVNAAFCHATGCPYGGESLDVGMPIGVAFQLSSVTREAVAAEVWFQGRKQYLSNFSPSSNGAYYDILPAAAGPGPLELRVFVGGRYIGSIRAVVD